METTQNSGELSSFVFQHKCVSMLSQKTKKPKNKIKPKKKTNKKTQVVEDDIIHYSMRNSEPGEIKLLSGGAYLGIKSSKEKL